jgi:predicted amidohydrolase YtcJ
MRGRRIFADGVIRRRRSITPYTNAGDTLGLPNLTQERFDTLATALDKAGFQIQIHAIGDGAVQEALNALAAARKANGVRDSRHHIAHLELIDTADVPRFRELGVIANFQPLWMYRDSYITDLTEPIVGPERSARLYPIGEVMRSGAVVAAGSDWDVSSMNPIEAIQVAVTRRDPSDTTRGPVWLPDQLVNLPQMLAAYTINGAGELRGEGNRLHERCGRTWSCSTVTCSALHLDACTVTWCKHSSPAAKSIAFTLAR